MAPAARHRALHRAWRAAALAAAALAAGTPTLAEATRPLDGGAIVSSIKFDGRLHVQHDSFDGVYSEDGARRSASYPRRARLGLSGRLPWRLKYSVDVDFERGGTASLRTAALAYSGLAAGTLHVGRFDPDFGLEQATSSNWITGIERSAAWDLMAEIADIGKGHGLQFDHAAQGLYGSVGAFRKPESRGMVARAAFAPIRAESRVVHLGLSLASERLDGDDGRHRTRFAVRGVTENDGGNRVTLARRLDDDVVYSRHRLLGLEFAAASGPFSVQAEALQRRLSGGAPGRVASGQYVQLAWTLTGETRPYQIDGAKFGRIQPANPRLGAWELFVRHDRLGVRGEPGLLGRDRSRGRAQANVVGVNWYAKEWFRVSANGLRARTDGIVNAVGDEAGDAFSLRVQMVF